MPTQPDDDELELIRRSGAVQRVGRLSLSAGTGSYRVKASMARVAHALGIDRHEALVTLTEITTTSHRGHSFRTEVTEVRAVGINAARLAELEHMATRVEREPDGVTVETVHAELDRIEKTPMYSTPINATFAAIACGAFAFLNGGALVEVLGAAVGAFFGQYLRRTLGHKGINQFGGAVVSSILACLVYLGFVNGLHALGATSAVHTAGYVASVLFLIPGFALVNAALDLTKLDFSAGLARATHALMILTSAGLGIWAVSIVIGLQPDPPPSAEITPVLLWTFRAAASFLGVYGFAIMFNSPWKMATWAASIGMVANVARLYLVKSLDVPPQAGAVIAALLVGLIAAYVAPRVDVPRITIYVPAVVIMVPGVAAYRAIYFMSQGQTVDAITYGVEAALVVAGIAIGLAIGRMLTDKSWLYDR